MVRLSRPPLAPLSISAPWRSLTYRAEYLATVLISQVGYGNVAGFLFNKGIVTGPPSSAEAPGSADPSAPQINPITGAIQEERAEIEMTEEERELEAERLFVLFDRLERTGAVPPEANPVRRAIQRSFS
jgi:Guanine nucleotide exchange factor synembryn